jgi:tRNA (guanine37-N1)-methyltransferase
MSATAGAIMPALRAFACLRRGGGDGMLMMIEPLQKTLQEISNPGPIIYLSPQGTLFDDEKAKALASLDSFTLICGRYAGIDQRFLNEFVDEEISIGNYVLTGGELAAAIITDCVVRLIPGVLGNEESALTDSFQDDLLAPPVYTRPAEFQGLKVPDVLLSGNFKLIEEWRSDQAEERTKARRPNL